MVILQAFFADRNKFTFIAGGAAAFGKPIHRCVPEEVFFALHNAVYIRLEVIILMNGNGFLKCFDGEEFRKIVLATEFGILCGGHEILQYFTLRGNRVVLHRSMRQSLILARADMAGLSNFIYRQSKKFVKLLIKILNYTD